ncbi:MAG: bifunctional 5,10-methylenetetrahydrofolate dehydrogenase/5,10-methenyltetrahydrofolate cyclohydrolase [Armatimonadetes bacterium]|nr:bifunctional 5,10-methylenetetrahydrofolate dehydrogenase/5,10-methenyltetrahydrofolate cyclohydrolase [Armatimonadota bacterium]
MNATILDGRSLAMKLREELKEQVKEFVALNGFKPKLATILVGDDPASTVYVAIKRKVAEELGFEAEVYHLPKDKSESEVIKIVERLNEDKAVSGILVQHPMPSHINEDKVMVTIDPSKDVDGLTPFSLGCLATGTPNFIPCTPLGALKLLQHYGISLEGKEVVIVGCSRINGLPAALLFLQNRATVTICHIYTRDLAYHTRRADILYAAAGNAEFITADMLKPGVIVIDTGSNRVPNRKGDVGDVHFESVKEIASYITPVPGGIGPMTVTMLMFNTFEAAKRQVLSMSNAK